MICIVDYKLGNFASIHNMLKRLGVESVVTDDPKVVLRASKIILPGVGAYDEGMRSLRELGLADVLIRRVVEEHVPLLAVCLGMQLLGESSEEGTAVGFGWLPMRFKRFEAVNDDRRLKTIHMGWNEARPVASGLPLFGGFQGVPRFYFVHRYYAVCHDERHILARSTYGIEFASAVGHENVLGVQFHPEKSHRFGFQLYRNFVEG